MQIKSKNGHDRLVPGLTLEQVRLLDHFLRGNSPQKAQKKRVSFVPFVANSLARAMIRAIEKLDPIRARFHYRCVA